MPASLLAHHLTVERAGRTVLDDVDVSLTPGRRLGVVGPNGIGKSTLLTALAGQLDASGGARVEGVVERRPGAATVGLLAQEPERRDEEVEVFLARRTGVSAAQRELDAAVLALAASEVGSADRYDAALTAWSSLGAADLDARIGGVLDELGLDARLRGRSMATLSGGEAARATLASLLLSRFDVVLLDEPTNDLDLESLARLERWVVGLDAPVALVSHDRTFLARTVTDVLEIDHHSRSSTTFAGGWAAFVREREVAHRRARERYEQFDDARRRLLDRRQREREWTSRGAARARRSDERDKFVRHHQLDQTEQLAGRAARTDRAIERLEVVDEPHDRWELRYRIPDAERSGDVVATATGAVVERDGFRLGPVDLDVAVGDRIAVVGANGSGKSTLIALLLGRVEATAGRVALGVGVRVGEITQGRLGAVGDEGLLAAFEARTGLAPAEARTLLAKFGLGPDHLHRPGGTLSPGERTRASMAELMARGANVLVLDEPTNHLDLDAIEQLEVAIEAFSGTVLLVTHDRSLLASVRIDRVLRLGDGVVVEADPSEVDRLGESSPV
ncbi:ABC-F family ATP-binding cassette domain-containing protein [Ilumatobacter sp.]|uniref:ABC-F family ATP-binding cassette domain-containing protein n=1 Tax=Ilumatobacter sp. TaxID=1967498 RepID=UPI003B52736A